MVRTLGRTQHSVLDHRIVLKPSIGKPYPRTRGVNRVSNKVIGRNKKFKEEIVDIIKACRGKPWVEYRKCLSKKAIEKLGLDKSKELGTAYSKTLEYRQKNFWVHKAE